MQRMTMRERMLAVIQGREHDRVPFAMYEIAHHSPGPYIVIVDNITARLLADQFSHNR